MRCSFMTMGDAAEDSEEELESPRPGEPVQLASDSYAEEALAAQRFHHAGGRAAPTELYRMEDDKAHWDGVLDQDVAAAATVLAEQMQNNPEDGGQNALDTDDDLAQVADPLGHGVLNQSTFQLDAQDGGAAGNTRRQLHKLARYQAGQTMMLDASTMGTDKHVRAGCRARCAQPSHVATKRACSERSVHADGRVTVMQKPPTWLSKTRTHARASSREPCASACRARSPL